MRFTIQQSVVAVVLAFGASVAMAAAPTDPADAFVVKGDQEWAAGRLDAAQQAFEQALKTQPRSFKAVIKLAGLQLSRQDFVASGENYKRAIGLDAQSARAWLGLGFAYLHTGSKDLSRAAFEEAIRIDPANKAKLAPLMAKLDAP